MLYNVMIHYNDGTVSETILDREGMLDSLDALDAIGLNYTVKVVRHYIDEDGHIEYV